MSVHTKYQSSRLAGYTKHIYTNVLFYFIDSIQAYLYKKYFVTKYTAETVEEIV